MRLLRLTLENYRRFEGEHQIEFAPNEDRNVTIIQAQNGAGKTGILMALLFGLFGVVKYQEFNIETDTQDILINRNVLKRESTAHARVVVEFTNAGKHYEIERTIQGSYIKGRVSQKADDIKSIMKVDGLMKSENTPEINDIMNGMIGENIRGFLFFDGVKYMNLFKQDHKRYKKDLQEIIERMLNIDDLDKTIRIIELLESDLSKRTASKRHESEKAKLLSQQRELQEDKKEHKKAIEDLESDIAQNEKRKQDIEFRLEEMQEYADILEHLRTEREKRNDKEKQLGELQTDITRLASSALKKLLVEKVGKDIRPTLEDKISSSETLDKALVKSILDTEECICGNRVEEDEKRELESVLSEIETGRQADPDYIYLLKKMYDDMHWNPDDPARFADLYVEWENAMDELNSVIFSIQEYEAQLPDEIQELSDERAKESENLGSVSQRIASMEKELKDREEKLDDTEESLKKNEQELDTINEQIALETGKQNEYGFYKSTKKNLRELREDYLRQAQEEISIKANEFFQQLLSEHDKKAFERLKINEDYRIEAYDVNNSEVFQQLSAGQKHLAAMAFTMGLTAVATQAKSQFEFPLVMDTPFSNLDTPNRRRLITLMPQVVNQWTLTPMDTELSDNEIDAFQETGSVGAIYQLIKYGPTSRIIKHESLDYLKGGG